MSDQNGKSRFSKMKKIEINVDKLETKLYVLKKMLKKVKMDNKK